MLTYRPPTSQVEAAELVARNEVSFDDFEDNGEQASSNSETLNNMKQR